MAKKKGRVIAKPLPGVFVGRNPDTGQLFRLTIDGEDILIERKPYISKLDGWKVVYQPLKCKVQNHIHLIDKIKSNPL